MESILHDCIVQRIEGSLLIRFRLNGWESPVGLRRFSRNVVELAHALGMEWDGVGWNGRSVVVRLCTPEAKRLHDSRLVRAFGESKYISRWAQDERCVVGRQTLYDRLHRGIPPEQAITLPSQHHVPFMARLALEKERQDELRPIGERIAE